MTRHTPSDTVERDLCNLVSERVRRAVMSVVQLTDDPTQAFVVASAAEAAVAGILAASFCSMTGQPKALVDPSDVAIAVLQSARAAAVEAGR